MYLCLNQGEKVSPLVNSQQKLYSVVGVRVQDQLSNELKKKHIENTSKKPKQSLSELDSEN